MSQLRFFDANTMIGRWLTEKLAFHRVQDLVEQMDYLGIERALVHHCSTQFDDVVSGNKTLMEEISDYDRLSGCWVLVPPFTPEMGTVDTVLAEMKKNKIRAVRLFPQEHGFELAPWNAGELLAALEQNRIPVLIDRSEADLADIQQVCETYPKLPVVLTRQGYREARTIYALLAQYQNFYLELSFFMLYRGVEEIVERFGAERILFGTGMPIQDPAGAVTRLRYAEISQQAKEMIAHKNLENLLDRVSKAFGD